MTVETLLPAQPASTSGSDGILSQLPDGSAVERIAFVTLPASGDVVVLVFPRAIRRSAVAVRGGAADRDVFSVLTVPIPAQDAPAPADANLLSVIRKWIDADADPSDPPSLLLTFQGAHVLWSRRRCAVLAPLARHEPVRKGLVEAAFYEWELIDVENLVSDSWPHFESDMSLAFEFEEKALGRRNQLRERLERSLLVRARLARIRPYIHLPHVHPPTLSSQIAERLRDRLRMTQRHESLESQAEIVSDVYELCGHRASEFRLARTGFMLEWIIIILLALQSVLWCVDLMSSASTNPSTDPSTIPSTGPGI